MSTSNSHGAQFLTSCYFMQSDGSQPPDEKLQVNGRSVIYNYFRKEKDPRQEYPFDILYNTQEDYAKSSYLTVIAPLVKKAIHGDSTMAIFGGLQSLNLNNYALSQTFMQGMISQAAGQLLHAINSQSEKLGSVTFSWYTIDCQNEALVDILQAASLKPSTNNSNATNTSTNKDTKETLVFRDMGRGRNMAVQGLLELEITSGQDIETVIQHVSQLLVAANHRAGTAHTVMQLIINNPGKARQYAKNTPAASSSNNNSASDVNNQAFGAGRVTFLCLGSLAAHHSQALPHKSSLSSPTKQNSIKRGASKDAEDDLGEGGRGTAGWDVDKEESLQYAWPIQIQEILTWLDHRRAAPPFHRSRLLLLLREVLMRRQHASLMLLLQPTVNSHHINKMWLQFAQHWYLYRQNTMPASSAGMNTAGGGAMTTPIGSGLSSLSMFNTNNSNNNNTNNSSNTPASTGSFQVNKQHAGRTPTNTTTTSLSQNRSLSRPRSGILAGVHSSQINAPSNTANKHGHNVPSANIRSRSAPGSRSASPAPPPRASSDLHNTNANTTANANSNTPYYLKNNNTTTTNYSVNNTNNNSDAESMTGFADHGYFYAQDETPAAHHNANTNASNNVDKQLENENLLLRTLHGGGAHNNTASVNTLSSPPPPPPPLHTTTTNNNSYANMNNNSSTNMVAGYKTPQPRNNAHNMSSSSNNRSFSSNVANNNNNSSNNSVSHSNNNNGNNNVPVAEGKGIAYAEDFAHSESEAALSLALEASRNESAALRIAYQYAQDKYKETQSQLDVLLSQLQEEGATLKQRDKERFRLALRDIKDYEIYKQVMETAMMKLQQQLASVVQQNEDMRRAKVAEERQNQRQRSFSEKYSKDLVATKRKTADLESQISGYEQRIKVLTREREAAVSALSQHSTQTTQKLGHLSESLALKTREYDDVFTRMKIAEEKNQIYEAEKQQLLQLHTKDMENLRNAHSKALESLMRYQEENDALRGAIFDLTGSHHLPTNNTNNTNNSSSSNSKQGVNLQAIQLKLAQRHPLAGHKALSTSSRDDNEHETSY